MRYVKLELAVNSESKWDVEEKAVWDKYYNEIANKEVADERGYFWVVSEAKIVEGSAVVKGSNFATPTISVEAVKDTPTEQTEPLKDTQKEQKLLKELLNKFN
jgi:predicted methyltransferase